MAEYGETRKSTRRSAQAPVVEPGKKNCLFCGSLKKKIRGSTSKQGTSQLLTKEAESRLKNAATIRKDERILIAVGTGDLIAREVHYHKVCYNDYTRELSLSKFAPALEPSAGAGCTSNIIDDGSDREDSLEVSLEASFLNDVERMLFDDSCVTSLGHLASLYKDTLKREIRNDKLKILLMDKFRDTIVFASRGRKRTELIYAAEREHRQ